MRYFEAGVLHFTTMLLRLVHTLLHCDSYHSPAPGWTLMSISHALRDTWDFWVLTVLSRAS